MTFSEAERRYIGEQRLGRLATIGPGGEPHVQPVAYWWEDVDETIDIGGPDLRNSRKFRNIQADPRVSFVIDDESDEPVGPGGQRGRGIEIRGDAEILIAEQPLLVGFSNEVLRILPRRVNSWNVDGPGRNARDV